MDVVISILIFQALLGGFDVIWNHELKERLPSKRTAALEQKIHGIRELLYAVVFLGLAWYLWQGVWAWLMFSVIAIEVILTALDFVIEDQTRLLSPLERITHLVLSMVGGAYFAMLMPVLLAWSRFPSHIFSTDYGIRSWILSVFGFGVFAWGIRDMWSGFMLAKGDSHVAMNNQRRRVNV